MIRYDWDAIVPRALDLHDRERFDSGVSPTLRRLHYLLVSDAAATAAGYANTSQAYKSLSARLTTERDAGRFPELDDRTRTISYPTGALRMPDVSASVRRWADTHTLSRDAHMPVRVVLIAEKDGIMPLLDRRYDWMPLAAVRGYASVTHANRISNLREPRGTAALYVGDYDPSGLDITRALAERLPFRVHRVALTREHVEEFSLPPAPAKATDSRTAGMLAREGTAVQVELDALPSLELYRLIDAALLDVSGVLIRDDGTPDLPDVDAEELENRERLSAIADLVADALGGEAA